MRLSRFAGNFERLQFLSDLHRNILLATKENPIVLIYKKIGRLNSPEFQGEARYLGFVEPKYQEGMQTGLSSTIPFTSTDGQVRRFSVHNIIEFSTVSLPGDINPEAPDEITEDKLVTLKIPASFLATLSAQVPEISNYLVQDE